MNTAERLFPQPFKPGTAALALSRHLPDTSQLPSSGRGRQPAGKGQKSVDITIFYIDFGDPFIGM
jgi:hypothetical protein